MRRLALLPVVLATLAMDGAAAQQITTTVDRSEIGLDEQISLRVRVEGARVQPSLPYLPDFRVVPMGHMEQMQTVNGRRTASIAFNYVLIPERTGTFEIGAATVTVDGETLSSRPFKVRVVESSGDVADRDYYLTARVSNPEPFVGEEVLYTWRFFRRVPIQDASLSVLEFGDLVAEELGELREYDTTVSGVQYRVSEIRRALFAQRPGKVTIPPSQLVVAVAAERQRRPSVFDFGRARYETKTLRTLPIDLEIRPLPSPPAGFSGLVGDFSISAELTKSEVAVGESTSLTVTISGAGNVQMIAPPRMAELTGFKVYEDKPSGSIDRSGNRLQGRKSFTSALVPLEPGEPVVPSLRLVSFDPDSERYVADTTPELRLDVRPSENEEELMLTESLGRGADKVRVRVRDEELLPLRRTIDEAVRPAPFTGWRAGVWGGALAVPPVALLAALGWRRRQLRWSQDVGARRRRTALRRALAKIRELEKGGRSLPPEQLVAAISLCLRNYVGDKLDREGAALTAEEVEKGLCGDGVPAASARRVREVLERLEAAQYGVGSGSIQPVTMLSSLGALLRDVDKTIEEAA